MIGTLADVMVLKGVPKPLRSHNCLEFVAKVLRKCLPGTEVKTLTQAAIAAANAAKASARPEKDREPIAL